MEIECNLFSGFSTIALSFLCLEHNQFCGNHLSLFFKQKMKSRKIYFLQTNHLVTKIIQKFLSVLFFKNTIYKLIKFFEIKVKSYLR
jgi:hypothetical protein